MKNGGDHKDEYVTAQQALQIAERAADRAVVKTLTFLGFDASYPLDLQQDAAWLRQARLGEQATRGVLKKAAIGAVVTGVCFLLWAGMRFWIGSGE